MKDVEDGGARLEEKRKTPEKILGCCEGGLSEGVEDARLWQPPKGQGTANVKIWC